MAAARGVAVGFSAQARTLSTRELGIGHGSDVAGGGLPLSPCLRMTTPPPAARSILHPANYSAVTIAKATSIVNDSAGSRASRSSVAGPPSRSMPAQNDSAFLRGLTIDGVSVSAFGVRLNSGGVLTINCTARHFTAYGILVAPASEGHDFEHDRFGRWKQRDFNPTGPPRSRASSVGRLPLTTETSASF